MQRVCKQGLPQTLPPDPPTHSFELGLYYTQTGNTYSTRAWVPSARWSLHDLGPPEGPVHACLPSSDRLPWVGTASLGKVERCTGWEDGLRKGAALGQHRPGGTGLEQGQRFCAEKKATKGAWEPFNPSPHSCRVCGEWPWSCLPQAPVSLEINERMRRLSPSGVSLIGRGGRQPGNGSEK